MTDYFRIKMGTSKNWVDELPYFYYTYNNRVNRVTRPRTPYQIFFQRPNFAPPVEEQIPFENLTREEKEFLKTAHVDVEDEENTENYEVMETRDENADDDMITFEQSLQVLEDNSDDVQDSNQDQDSPLTTEDDDQDSNLNNDSPPKRMCYIDRNNQVNVKSTVSDYYRDLYRQRFGQHPLDVADRQPFKELRSTYQVMDSERYPLELFSENLVNSDQYFPQSGDEVRYRLNPSMAKGTAVFSSGYWHEGMCTGVQRNPNRGTLYTVVDNVTQFSYEPNRYQIRLVKKSYTPL